MYFVLGQRFLPNFFLNCKLDNAKRSRGGGRINTSFWLASFSDAKQLYRRPFPVHHRAVLPLLISHITHRSLVLDLLRHHHLPHGPRLLKSFDLFICFSSLRTTL